jgi:hypothetical protein
MTRPLLRRFFKATTLAFAISMIIAPSALSMPLVSAGGSGATETRSLGPRDNWNVPVSTTPLVDNVYGRAPEPTALTTANSPGRANPDVILTPTSTPTLHQPTGFDWGDARLVAAGGFALTALLIGAALVAVRQRQLPLAHR